MYIWCILLILLLSIKCLYCATRFYLFPQVPSNISTIDRKHISVWNFFNEFIFFYLHFEFNRIYRFFWVVLCRLLKYVIFLPTPISIRLWRNGVQSRFLLPLNVQKFSSKKVSLENFLNKAIGPGSYFN